ncbi:TPA: restriction endonuclease subunit S [Vibrio parahaemolyticus]
MSNVVPENWTFEPLGKYISDSTAGEWGTDACGDQNDIPVLRATNFSQSGMIDYRKLAIRNIEEKKRVRKSLIRGDIVIEKSGGSPTQPVGRVIYFDNDKPFLYSNFTQKLSPSKMVDSKFMFYKLYEEYANGTVSKFQQQTTGIINFQLAEYLLYKSVFPPLPEQKKIAAILTSVDGVIEKTQAQIDKLKDLKTGMMQELLTRGVGVDGKPHTEFKDSPVGRVPAEWDTVKLASVLSKIDSGWSPACIEMPPATGEWGVVKVSAVTRGRFLEKESKTLPEELKPKPHIQIKRGDILLTRANGVADLVGKCVMVSSEPKAKLMMSDKILRLNANDKVYSKFLLHYFNSRHIRKQIELSWGGSSGQKNISQADIKGYFIALPSLNEQMIIGDSISQIDTLLSVREAKLRKLEDSKKALMQDLLTGKVRVKVED